MNINPHLQYLQQQQQPQPQQTNTSGQSPQISQLQLQQQRHLQQQRQQLLNQHLQQPQQPQQPPAQSTNPLLAALNGGINQNNTSMGPNNGLAPSFGQSVNPLLQLQLQQLQQPQQRLFLNQNMPQQHMLQSQQQAPVIKEVWSFNLEHEFSSMRTFINDKTSSIFISIHQEIPGIVARPVGTFKSSTDYHFQTLRSNLDLLNLIQLSLCAVKVRNNEVSGSVIWQFNFLYDLTKEMFNEEHLLMLTQTSQINFASHMSQGILHFAFAELMMESGLLLDPTINWLSYHSGYDLGFLVSLLTNDILPGDEREFFWWCSKYFPNFYDLKHIANQLLNGSGKVSANGLASGSSNEFGGVLNPNGGNAGANSDLGKGLSSNNKPSVEYLAEDLHLLPISPAIRQRFTSSSMGQFPNHQHQQMTSTLHAYLLMECFKELLRQTNYDLAVFDKFKGFLWGLGDAYVHTQLDARNEKTDTSAVSQQW